jgi:cytochrome c553
MEPIARRLQPHQINELAAYYASLPWEEASATDPAGEPTGR